MKIAVTYENGQIFQHFGHTEQFKLYEAADGKITHAEVVDTNGSGHGALAGFLMQNGVDTLICGGIGGGAQAMMSMLPGMNKMKVSEKDIDEKRIEHTKAMILSMTQAERDNPSIIDSKRKRRIAAGSGTSVQEINQLLKQFEQTKLLMKQLKGNKGKFRMPF